MEVVTSHPLHAIFAVLLLIAIAVIAYQAGRAKGNDKGDGILPDPESPIQPLDTGGGGKPTLPPEPPSPPGGP